MAVVKAKRINAQPITFPENVPTEEKPFRSLLDWGQKLRKEVGPAAEKYIDQALDALMMKQRRDPKRLREITQQPGADEVVASPEDQTLRVQSIISNVNRYKTFIKSSGDLVNNVVADQKTLFSEYKRVRDLVTELRQYVNRETGSIAATPESGRIMESLEDAYSNITILMGRIQDSVEDSYDTISNLQIEGRPQIMTPEMTVEE